MVLVENGGQGKDQDRDSANNGKDDPDETIFFGKSVHLGLIVVKYWANGKRASRKETILVKSFLLEQPPLGRSVYW